MNWLYRTLLIATLPAACTIDQSVVLPAGQQPRSVRVIDGSVELEPDATAARIRVIDGDILLLPRSRVTGDLKLTDGKLTSSPGVTVEGNVHTHYAQVDLQGTEIKGDLETYCTGGSVIATHIRGALVVRNRALWYVRCDSSPKLVIGPGSNIGELIVRSDDVIIEVSDEARIQSTVRE